MFLFFISIKVANFGKENMKNQKGFTMVEALMVMIMIFFMMMILFSMVGKIKEDQLLYKQKSQESQNENDSTQKITNKNSSSIKNENVFFKVFNQLPVIKKEGNIYDISIEPDEQNKDKINWNYFFFDNLLVTDLNRLHLLCPIFNKNNTNNTKIYNIKKVMPLYESRKHIEISYKPLSIELLNAIGKNDELLKCNLSIKDDTLYMSDKEVVVLTNINEI